MAQRSSTASYNVLEVACMTLSCNIHKHLTKLRLLVAEVSPTTADLQWYVVTFYDTARSLLRTATGAPRAELAVGFVPEGKDDNSPRFETLMRNLNSVKLGEDWEAPITLVLRLDPVHVRTATEAVRWSRLYMRGNHLRLYPEDGHVAVAATGFADTSDGAPISCSALEWCRRQIHVFETLKREAPDPSTFVHVATTPSSDYCWTPALHCVTPDGVCTHKCEECYEPPYYTRRGVICSFGDQKAAKNLMGQSDERVLGYGRSVDEAIKSVVALASSSEPNRQAQLGSQTSGRSEKRQHPLRDRGSQDPDRDVLGEDETRDLGDELEVWDLETCSELNLSQCGTMSAIDMKGACETRLLKILEETCAAFDERRESLRAWFSRSARKQNGGIGPRDMVVRDAIVFDKYRRTVEGPLYMRGWAHSEAIWNAALEVLARSDYLSLTPLLQIVRSYVQPARVTADDLRRTRVKRWFGLLRQSNAVGPCLPAV